MQNHCQNCGRPRHVDETEGRNVYETPLYGYVVHDSFGCDTGCCGHRFYLADLNGHVVCSSFEFTHPYGNMHGFREDIKNWGRENGVPIHWGECELSDD